MKMITCPYCGEHSTLIDIEEEGGECPYCGAQLEEEGPIQRSSKRPVHHDDGIEDEKEKWTKGYK